MTKARDLADLISAGNPLADGTITVAEVSGAAPLASPTFTGTVTADGLTVDTDTLYVDSTNNRVGVGTSSPSGNLHVNSASNALLKVTGGSAAFIRTLDTNGPTDEKQWDLINDNGNVVWRLVNDADNAVASIYSAVRSGNTVARHEWYVGTNSEAMRIDSSGVVYASNSIQEGYTALSGTTPTVDADTAGSFALTTSGNTTFTFSAVTSGRTVGFVLKLTAGGSHTITWPASVDWAAATAPDAPASGETDVLVFYTVDGGTTWYGARAIDAAA